MTASSKSHSHAGHSHEPPTDFNRAFAIAALLNILYISLQVGFGIVAHSLALIADAGHNLGDVLGLILAWVALRLGKRPPTARHTYGFRRSSILASLANAVLLLVAVGAITWEAVHRFSDPAPVAGRTVIWVAALGVVVNGFSAWLFAAGRKGDLNVKGAFLHLAADAAVSGGVVLAGVAILFTGWQWIDPVMSLVVNAVIVVSTWGLLRRALDMALDAVPENIDLGEVRGYLAALPGVERVHDLHVWPLSTTDTALTAHLVLPAPAAGGTGDGHDALLARASRELHDRFGIEHTTIQIENQAVDCRQAAEDTI